MSSIVVYFSRNGSNWVDDKVDNLEVGNCEILAKYIQKQINADIFKIETKKQYTNEYYKATEEAKEELQNNARPELLSYPENFEKYNTIYLIYPIWWGTCPMAVFSFLEKYDFSNKTIFPFCTHEGSGISNSVSDIKKYAQNAKIKNAFEVRGYKCQNLDKDVNLQAQIKDFLNQ